jgi:RNA polymerase sigma factor (sigma-70 family)
MWGELRLLARDEEIDLARRLRAARGPEERRALRDRLAHHNLRLVFALARRYRGLGIAHADLVQEGCLGLLHAIERFDPERGARFATYAAFWIRQALRRAVQSQSRLVRLPNHVDAALWRAGRALPAPVSLDAESPLARRLHETLADPAAAHPGDEVCAAQLRRALAAVIGRLPPAEREVLGLRFGLADGAPRTQHETARALDCTRGRVRALELRGLARLSGWLAQAAGAAEAEASKGLAASASR